MWNYFNDGASLNVPLLYAHHKCLACVKIPIHTYDLFFRSKEVRKTFYIIIRYKYAIIWIMGVADLPHISSLSCCLSSRNIIVTQQVDSYTRGNDTLDNRSL